MNATFIILTITNAIGIGAVILMVKQCLWCRKHGHNYDLPASIAAAFIVIMICSTMFFAMMSGRN